MRVRRGARHNGHRNPGEDHHGRDRGPHAHEIVRHRPSRALSATVHATKRTTFTLRGYLALVATATVRLVLSQTRCSSPALGAQARFSKRVRGSSALWVRAQCERSDVIAGTGRRPVRLSPTRYHPYGATPCAIERRCEKLSTRAPPLSRGSSTRSTLLSGGDTGPLPCPL